jgi:hypothetical protein
MFLFKKFENDGDCSIEKIKVYHYIVELLSIKKEILIILENLK